MAEIKVICPECGKKVSLRGLNGHLRFEHGYDLVTAKKMAAGIGVDGLLSRLEQDVMEHVRRLYRLKEEAELLRRSREEGVIGEELYAASAYMSNHPVLLGTLKAQDWGKVICIAALVVATIVGLLTSIPVVEWFEAI